HQCLQEALHEEDALVRFELTHVDDRARVELHESPREDAGDPQRDREVCAVLDAPDQEEVVLLAERGELALDVEQDDLDLAEGFPDHLAQRVALPAAAVRLQQESGADERLDVQRCGVMIWRYGAEADGICTGRHACNTSLRSYIYFGSPVPILSS